MAQEEVTARLSVRGFRRAWPGVVVLNGIDLDVGAGETLAVVGRSGCGKSTLLRCLSALEGPVGGDARLDGRLYLASGRPLFEPHEIRQDIVMVAQDYNLFPNMTGMRNITLALEKTRRMRRPEAERLATSMARQLGVDAVLDRYPGSFSGGQAQRLALARAMVLQPKVLLLDEITGALDPETILDVFEALRRLRAADSTGRMAIVMVTHLLRFAATFADRIAFLHEGRIYEELPAREFLTGCVRPESRKFVSALTSF